MWDKLWINLNLATMAPGGEAYGAIEDGAIGVADGRIAWVGQRGELPGAPQTLAKEVRDGGGRWMTPGLIDCHTHIVFGGERAREFEMRLKGATYEEIARAGGGIPSTVLATRAASEEALFEGAAKRLQRFLAEGVTTVEVKSGYGLETEAEMRMLRVARRLGREFPVEVKASFLGAHALAKEYAGRPDDYIDMLAREMLPAVAASGLADAVDAFCDTIGFTAAQTARLFDAARAHGLPVKLHADQLSDFGGAALTARYDGLSADHLEYASEAGLRAMAASGTVAVLLPGADYFLRETHLPPIALMRETGVAMALASNCNPGSSPALSLLLMLSMGSTILRLTPEEALEGVTRNAAKALGLKDRGVLAPGLRADLALFDIGHPAELAYWIGHNPCVEVVRGGEVVRG
jgi:imidazolonepropionase